MKTLILLRHAKSSWSDPDLADHDRPLNKRGKASAPVMGRWLAERGLVPDCILCSTSRRTRQTVKQMRGELKGLPDPVLVPSLYHAGPEDFLAAIRGAPAEAKTVMVVAHEPGTSATAELLCAGEAPPELGAAFEHFPTAAIAVFEIKDSDWAGLDWGRARFTHFAKPRDLMEPSATNE